MSQLQRFQLVDLFLLLATELAGIEGTDLPTEISAVDSLPNVTDSPQRSLGVVGRLEIPLATIYLAEEGPLIAAAFECSISISQYLLDRVQVWMEIS
jgi:hypothetical protein